MKSLVAVVPFSDSRNGHKQVKLVVIEGDDLPARLAIQTQKYAALHNLNVGDEKLIIWREAGEEKVVRNGIETNEIRQTYTYDVLEGGLYSSTYIVESAKAVAKMQVKMQATRPTLSRATTAPKVTPKTPTASEILTERFLAETEEEGQIKVVKDALLQFAGDDAGFNDWFEGVGITPEVLAKAKA